MSSNNDNTHTYIALTKGTMVSHYRIVEKIGARKNVRQGR